MKFIPSCGRGSAFQNVINPGRSNAICRKLTAATNCTDLPGTGWATMECCAACRTNAALLQQVGYTPLQSGNQLIASLAQEMVDAGVHCGFYILYGIDRSEGSTSLQWVPLFSAANIGDVRRLVHQVCCLHMPC